MHGDRSVREPSVHHIARRLRISDRVAGTHVAIRINAVPANPHSTAASATATATATEVLHSPGPQVAASIGRNGVSRVAYPPKAATPAQKPSSYPRLALLRCYRSRVEATLIAEGSYYSTPRRGSGRPYTASDRRRPRGYSNWTPRTSIRRSPPRPWSAATQRHS